MIHTVRFRTGHFTFISDGFRGGYWIPERLAKKIQRLWHRLGRFEVRGDS
jgi:hypothetical protein